MPRIIDLSTPIKTDHFRWSVDRRLLKSHADGDVSQATYVGVSCHAFTHMDSPRHFDPDGFTTDGIALDMVVGDAAVVDVSAVGANAPITEEDVAKAGQHIREGDIVLLRAGWDLVESIDTPEFWTNAPWVTAEAAQWLRGRKIKAIGYDFPQDYCIRKLVLGEPAPPAHEHTTHQVLLINGIIMMEYLCNMTAIENPRTHVVALPLKIPGSDGAPSRIIAIEPD